MSLYLQNLRAASISNSCMLCDLLDNQGVQGRVLFAGSSIIQAEARSETAANNNNNNNDKTCCVFLEFFSISD